MASFNGVYTALVTPLTDDGSEIDYGALEALIQRQAEGGVRGVVPCGTTGEAPALSDNEQRDIITTTVVAAHACGLEVIAGAGSNSTAHAIALHQTAADAGVDGALHVAPYYNKPSQAGVRAHFEAIARSATIPIMLYDIPGRCGVGIEPETVAALAEHPNIQCLKAARGSTDHVCDVRSRCAIKVLSGDDSMTLPMLSVGAQGVVSVLSNIMPSEVVALCDAMAKNDAAKALALHEKLYPIARGLLGLDVNPVPVKTALAHMGLCNEQFRLPLVGPTASVRTAVSALLAATPEPVGA